MTGDGGGREDLAGSAEFYDRAEARAPVLGGTVAVADVDIVADHLDGIGAAGAGRPGGEDADGIPGGRDRSGRSRGGAGQQRSRYGERRYDLFGIHDGFLPRWLSAL